MVAADLNLYLMIIAANPFVVLTVISAPAVLTNASCVLLFGTGNRYGRAVDRMHELSRQVDELGEIKTDEEQFRVSQLQAAERRSLLIVRALTCFYSSVAAFVLTTLVTLLGAILSTISPDQAATRISYWVGGVTGICGAGGLVAGSLLLVRETRESFVVLRAENRIITGKLKRRAASA
jgi:hypothetical protein